jgi:hypothetical protein
MTISDSTDIPKTGRGIAKFSRLRNESCIHVDKT